MFIILKLYIIDNWSSSYTIFDELEWTTTGFEGETINEMKQGEWKDFYLNGQLAEIKNYKNDTLNGIRIVYTPEGEYKLYEKYKMGVQVDTFKLCSGGKLNQIIA